LSPRCRWQVHCLLTLSDDLIGEGKKFRWHFDADWPGCFQIDDKLKLAGLLNRQIGRLLASENSPGMNSRRRSGVVRWAAMVWASFIRAMISGQAGKKRLSNKAVRI
jgi:hypothetical protein